MATATRKKPLPPPPSVPVSLYRKIVVSFLVLTTVLLIFIAHVLFVRATITIVPAREPVRVNFTVSVQPEPIKEDSVGGSVLETIVSGSREFQVSGGETEVVGTATGKVTLINNTSRSQPLVKTTRLLSSDGVLFRLSNYVTVPAAGEVEADVYSDKPGAESEIESTTFIIPGLPESLRDEIYATSKEKMTGGRKIVRGVAPEDLEKAKNELAEELFQRASLLLENEAGADLFGGKFFEKEILESESGAEVGEQKESFKTNVKLKVAGIFFDKEALNSLAESNLSESLYSDQKLSAIDLEGMTISLERYDTEEEAARLYVSLLGAAVIKDSSPIFDINRLAGMTRNEAVAYLKTFDKIENAEVKIFPFWMRRIPDSERKVRIIIREE